MLPRSAAIGVLILAAVVQSAPPGTGPIDYKSCQSPSDYGWPRFESEAALNASSWAAYFKEEYHGLPEEYPFCTFDLWWLNSKASSFAALKLTPDPSKASHGNHINHTWHKGDYNDGDLFETDFGMNIYHSVAPTVQNDTWLEIMHSLFPTETEAMWFSRERGTGIWYNVGKTISFVSDSGHLACFDYFGKQGCKYPPPPNPPPGGWSNLNCSDPKLVQYCLELAAGQENQMATCAAADGYESVQFSSAAGPIIETFGHVSWLELLSTSLRGNYSCGTAEGGTSAGFRFGWDASEPCDCIEGGFQYAPTNCKGNKGLGAPEQQETETSAEELQMQRQRQLLRQGRQLARAEHVLRMQLRGQYRQ